MMAMLAHQSLAAELPAIDPQFCRDGICFPAVCQADKASSEDTDRVDHVLNQPPGYDYIGFCNLNDDDIAEFLVRGNRSDGDECGSGSFTTCPPAPPHTPIPEQLPGCADHPEERDGDLQLLALWTIIVVYMFYGLAHVCEDFLVPALNIFCERKGVPEDVAGATIMAAGCNAPELFASIIGVFVQHSTVGAGTVVGSAPFNILCICGAAAIAVSGHLVVDGWLMVREIVSLLTVLGLFAWVMSDAIVLWWEALVLVGAYVVYVFVCIYYESILGSCLRRSKARGIEPPMLKKPTELPSMGAGGGNAREAMSAGLLAGYTPEPLGNEPLPQPADLSMNPSAASSAPTVLPLISGSRSMEMLGPSFLGTSTRLESFESHLIDSLESHLFEAGHQPFDVTLPVGGRSYGLSIAEHTHSGVHSSLQESRREAARGTELSASAAGQPELGSFSALVAACRERIDRYARTQGEVLAAIGPAGERIPVRMAGVLFKRSRFYSRVRMSTKKWQRRFFVLHTDTRVFPLRYHRIVANGPLDGTVEWKTSVAIPLHKVHNVVRFSSVELHLVTPKQKYKLRCGADVDPETIQQWFDHLIVSIDELRAQPPPSAGRPRAASTDFAPGYLEGRSSNSMGDRDTWGEPAEDDDEEHDELWYALPEGMLAKAIFILIVPLKAVFHFTIPDPARRADWYMVSLVLAVVWLAILAYTMNLALEKIGCALGVSETVMGLTLGAAGTSFPNLYASVLTARAGQAGMSLCQAFGSNTFNICICLGLVWLVQTTLGTCQLGRGGHILTPNAFGGACTGCYMPMGLGPMCPYRDGSEPVREAGSLVGAVYVTILSIILFMATPLVCRGKISVPAAALYFVVYIVYVVYEVLATYKFIPPLCLGSACI
jgi:K+-dependent Na+/Ca+ exchanger-like protein